MKILDRALHRRSLRKWQKAARDAPVMDLATLRRARLRARPLLTALGALIRTADARLVQHPPDAPGLPHGTDWSWRPEVWQGPLPEPGIAAPDGQCKLGRDMTVFHDCPRSELSLRQARNPCEAGGAPYALHLDVFAFEGSFLSLVLDLPPAAMDGLTRQHLVRLDTRVALEKPLRIFARLNMIHGPDTEQIVHELPRDTSGTTVEFDLAYTAINEKRLDRAWIDLIFETPHMSQAVLRDVTVSRRLRAAL